MRTALLLAAIALAAGWVGIRHVSEEAQAEPATPALQPQQIQSVSLDGRALPKAVLRDVLKTRAGDLIDLGVVQQDRKALEAELVARGYLTAQVAEPRVTFGEGRGVFVTFPITQGPLFRIRDVRVTGAVATEAGVITLGVGEVANADRIALARQALEERLAVRGAKRPVVARVVPDVAHGVADLELSASR